MGMTNTKHTRRCREDASVSVLYLFHLCCHTHSVSGLYPFANTFPVRFVLGGTIALTSNIKNGHYVHFSVIYFDLSPNGFLHCK